MRKEVAHENSSRVLPPAIYRIFKIFCFKQRILTYKPDISLVVSVYKNMAKIVTRHLNIHKPPLILQNLRNK